MLSRKAIHERGYIVKKGFFALALVLSLAPALLLVACAEKEVDLSAEEVNAAIKAKDSVQLPAIRGIPAPHGMAAEEKGKQ
jgi:hypothetical protein